MSQTSRLISGPCFASHVLRIIFISAFSFFVWTWPVFSNPLPCKDYFDGKAVYLLDRDNHLVPHFVDTGCHLSRRQNSRWNEESDLSNTGNRYSVHHRTGKALIPDISQISSEKGDKLLLLERTGHSTSGITKDVGWDEDEAILGIMNGNWREEVNAFHRENLGKAWERARESIRQAEMLQSASETLAPSVSSPPRPYSNYTGQLNHSYSAVPSPSVVVEKSPAIITQGVDSKLQDDTMEPYAESDDNLDFVPLIIITTSPEMGEEPEQFSNFEELPDFEEFSDFEELFESEEELSEYKEELFEAEELFRSEEPFGPEELYESGELSKAEELFEPGEFFESKEPLILEESGDDFSVEAVTLSGVSALPPISHYRPSKNFNKVLAKAVGLGLLMAIPSLIIMCALSRKGQYIWIRTVNMNDLGLPTSDHVRYEGGSRASENLSVMASIEGGENTGVVSGGVFSGTNGSGILERQNTGPNTMSGSTSNLESLERPDIGSRHGVESANRSGLASRQGLDGADFFLGSIGPVPVRKPGIFQRWFGWGVEHNDNLEETSLHASSSSTKQGSKIRSSRAISNDRTPDPNLVSEVCERLIRERMSRLSTIPSAGENEGSGTHEARELTSTSSIRAPVTGGASGTQGSAVKRNPHGILKPPGNSYGPDVSGEFHVADHGDSSTREENQAEEADSEGSSLKGKTSRLVRFDGSADKVDPQARGTFGRASIRRYLYPTVEDERSSLEAVSTSESSTLEMSDGTVIRKERKGERIGGMWGKVFSDPMVASRDSTDLGEMDVELEQQLREDGEYVDSSRGTSIGDDSTLDGNSNDEIVIVDGQLPMEEGHRPRLENPIDIPNTNTGAERGLVLNSLPRTQTSEDIATEGIDNNEAVVSAYGAREQSQMWDSQTSSGGSLLSTGYFTETNSSDHVSVEDVENFPL
ncbi:uncharacterized protein H6S33_000966 [Morchella sextelata]|uniref:uncharacterized protein n=1 Tax=Morchella sextelata TaxID=1174677 RepID=UPI001D051C4B|nr:uncharacterized protein H6S33_000966 [Morchella sextelata]KAH0615330.1 hypothetical protein H6S33_000966 [Morchella sextelata]